MLSTPLRQAVFWTLCLILLVMAPFFFIGGLDWTASPLERALWNSGHGFFFFCFALTILLTDRWQGWQAWLVITMAVAVVGVSIEVVQSKVGRVFDWHDVLLNLTGAWLALVLWPRARWRPVPLWSVLVVSVVLLGGREALHLSRLAVDEWRLQTQLPLVFDQSRPDNLRYWQGNIGWTDEQEGRYAQPLRLDLTHRRLYTGVFISRLPRDWRGYDQLQFRLYNPEPEDWYMTLRINDRAHDQGESDFNNRYNVRLPLTPGWNEFTLPLADVKQAPRDREMDLNRIQRLGLFATGLESPRFVLLDDLRLSRE
ncbi:MAG: VanZ family protein [Saccharospirillum sp.]|nr:VanZ family protein [Saccharospirillum sp.]